VQPIPQAHPRVGHGRLYAAFERAFEAALHAYERSLGSVMRHRPLTLVFSVLILVLTGVLFQFVPKGSFRRTTGATDGDHRSGTGHVVRRDGPSPDSRRETAGEGSDVLKFMSALGGNGAAARPIRAC